MDELQDVLVRIGLSTLASYGFALAGGYALQAHGLVDRMSEDVDLFTDRWDPSAFGRAVEAVTDAYRRHGLEVTVVRQAETSARIRAHDPRTGHLGEVDLAADYREHAPDRLAVGPVLAQADAVASKVAIVFSAATLVTTSTWRRSWRAAATRGPSSCRWRARSTEGSPSRASGRPSSRWTGSPTTSLPATAWMLRRSRRFAR